VIEEIESDNWGIGGAAVTPEILEAVVQGKA